MTNDSFVQNEQEQNRYELSGYVVHDDSRVSIVFLFTKSIKKNRIDLLRGKGNKTAHVDHNRFDDPLPHMQFRTQYCTCFKFCVCLLGGVGPI